MRSRGALARLILSVLCLNIFSTAGFALTDHEKELYDRGIYYYYSDAPASKPCQPKSGADTQPSGGIGDIQDGHRLPAVEGGMGDEQHLWLAGEDGYASETDVNVHLDKTASTRPDSVDKSAARGSYSSSRQSWFAGGHGAFGTLQPEDEQWYITMRWRYVRWYWDGSSTSSGASEAGQSSWYKGKRILVTNPETNKSIVAAAGESGPAPWTGSVGGKNSKELGWNQPQDGTPGQQGNPGTYGDKNTYTGRVSGLSPEAYLYLGVQQWTHGGPSNGGSGHNLHYEWAKPDAPLGPSGDKVAPPGCNGEDIEPGQTPDGFVFPQIITKTAIKKGYEGAVWCYKSQTNCHHDYNAADIHAPPGTVVVAAWPGTVVRATEEQGGVGSRVQIKGEDGNLYYYAHMGYGSLAVGNGQHVNAGTKLGEVGPDSQAMGTAAHTHFDMLPPSYNSRPSCSGSNCSNYPFINVQPKLVEAFQSLPE